MVVTGAVGAGCVWMTGLGLDLYQLGKRKLRSYSYSCARARACASVRTCACV